MESEKLLRDTLKVRSLLYSFRYAFQGALYLFIYHRNMRIIYISGIAALTAGVILGLSGFRMAILLVTISLVYTAEMFNTGIEVAMDIISTQYHSKVKIIKDIAAAAVLVASVNAVFVGYILFGKKIYNLLVK